MLILLCKAMDDPVYVESRAWYMIIVANFPIMWEPKLQSDATLSTLETKIVILALNC